MSQFTHNMLRFLLHIFNHHSILVKLIWTASLFCVKQGSLRRCLWDATGPRHKMFLPCCTVKCMKKGLGLAEDVKSFLFRGSQNGGCLGCGVKLSVCLHAGSALQELCTDTPRCGHPSQPACIPVWYDHSPYFVWTRHITVVLRHLYCACIMSGEYALAASAAGHLLPWCRAVCQPS